MSTTPDPDREPRRIARLGRDGGGQRLPRGMPRAVRRTGAGTATFGHRAHGQRVVVKVHVARHRSATAGRDSLRRHASYLARDGTALGEGRPASYDAKREGIDPLLETQEWSTDRHHFRVILSPENGGEIDDLRAYSRQVMKRMERDLETRLTWVAVNHFNTDNPHVHVLIRGRNDRDRDLVIARDYISHGIRSRASEVATEMLGERTVSQARTALDRQVQAERWTNLDRIIQRLAQQRGSATHFSMENARPSQHGPLQKAHLAGRMELLTSLGLAQETTSGDPRFLKSPRSWIIATDVEQRLRQLGDRNDIIKQMHAQLGRSEALVIARRMESLQAPSLEATEPKSLRGVVVAKGAVDELTDARFLVVRDHAGDRYTRVWASTAYDAIQVGGVVELGRRDRQRWRAIEEIQRVAAADISGHYVVSHHRELLRTSGKLTVEGVERRLRGFHNRLKSLARQRNSGVVQDGIGFRIEHEKLQEHACRIGRWPDLHVVAAHSIENQTNARAYTWLDRQLVRASIKHLPATDLTNNGRVREALDRRAVWLVEQGLARRMPEGEWPPVRLQPGAAGHLRATELSRVLAECKESRSRSVHLLRTGQSITGVYRRHAYLHAGGFAVIDGPTATVVVPVTREPWPDTGAVVTAHRVRDRYVRFELSGRSIGKGGLTK